MSQYEEMPKAKDGVEGLPYEVRHRMAEKLSREEVQSISSISRAMDRSKGASEAFRKYEMAKRDYAKASLLGKAYLKLTGQANFKKMLEEANKRGR